LQDRELPGRQLLGAGVALVAFLVLAGGYVKAWTAYRSILASYPADVQAKVFSETAIEFYGLVLPV